MFTVLSMVGRIQVHSSKFFCLIDSLGFIEFGTSSGSFNKIIRKRYVPLNIFYTGKDEELYSIRNGLVHAYGPSKEITKKSMVAIS